MPRPKVVVLFSTVVVVGGLATAACGGDSADSPHEVERLQRTQQAIQGGAAAEVNAYSIAICLGASPQTCSFRCSGTLVAPNLVLSVRHCLYPAPRPAVDCAHDVFGPAPSVVPDKVWTTSSQNLAGQGLVWHRGRAILAPAPRAVCGADIAGVILTDVVPSHEATPARVTLNNSFTDRSVFDTDVAAIGFGESSPTANDVGIRRIRQRIPIECLDGDPQRSCQTELGSIFTTREFSVGGGGCPGDSGSGAFDQASLSRVSDQQPSGDPLLVGILARGVVDNGACARGIYTRIDSWAPWIAGAAQLAAKLGGYEAPLWSQIANTEVLPEPSSLPPGTLGAACAQNEDCTSAMCASADKGFSFQCTQGCEAGACPAGFGCVDFAKGEKRCFKSAETPVPPRSNKDSRGCSAAPEREALANHTIDLVVLTFVVALVARRRTKGVRVGTSLTHSPQSPLL